MKWHWGKVNCCLIYGSHPEHSEHQGLLKYHASGISDGKGWLVCFWARHLVFFKDDPQCCHFALSRETVCFKIVLNKDSNSQREKNHPSSHLRCHRLVLWQFEIFKFFFLMLVFIITLPSYFVRCLEMLMNHSSIVISDGFGEASSMLVPVSCLLVLQPATGSHQSCIEINSFTFPHLIHLLTSFFPWLPFFQFSLCCAFKMHQKRYNTSFIEQKEKRWNDLTILRK